MAFVQKKVSVSDIVLISAVALICAASFFVLFSPQKTARTFSVKTPSGSQTYSLSQSTSFDVESKGIALRIEVSDGTVAVVSSSCPDHVCEQTGKISKVGQAIICIPAQVVIEISGEGGIGDADFIIR